MLVTGADLLRIKGMAQKAINIVANWASEQKLQFSSKTTEIVQFTHKRNSYLGSLSMNGSKQTFQGSKAVRCYSGQQANLETT